MKRYLLSFGLLLLVIAPAFGEDMAVYGENASLEICTKGFSGSRLGDFNSVPVVTEESSVEETISQ